MAKRLRILHLSDLHVGKEAAADHWRVERVMGDAWAANLREIAAEGAIDLVCFTGDLAQRGKPQEYDGVRAVIDAAPQSVGCPRERFFCVPGDHARRSPLSVSSLIALLPRLAARAARSMV